MSVRVCSIAMGVFSPKSSGLTKASISILRFQMLTLTSALSELPQTPILNWHRVSQWSISNSFCKALSSTLLPSWLTLTAQRLDRSISRPRSAVRFASVDAAKAFRNVSTCCCETIMLLSPAMLIATKVRHSRSFCVRTPLVRRRRLILKEKEISEVHC
jgi:hypothetical protein